MVEKTLPLSTMCKKTSALERRKHLREIEGAIYLERVFVKTFLYQFAVVSMHQDFPFRKFKTILAEKQVFEGRKTLNFCYIFIISTVRCPVPPTNQRKPIPSTYSLQGYIHLLVAFLDALASLGSMLESE